MTFNTKYLRGAVKIRISGLMPERFINLCIAEQILLWGITKKDEYLIAWIGLDDYFRIRPLVVRSRTKVKAIAHFGLPFAVKRIKRRKMLVAGGVLFIILLNILSSYVWFVDITGLKNISEEEIKAIASQYGLKPGAVKDNVNIKSIEREILLNVPQAAWVGINFTGTRAVIEVVEKTVPKQEDKAPAHIIARKDGVITEIIALAGQPAVKNDDTVKKGDLLIKGVRPEPVPTVNEGQPPVIDAPREFIRAKGIIKARVWYEGYAEAELTRTIATRTGNRQMSVVLKIGNREITLKPMPTQLFQEFQTEIIHKQLPLWRNSGFIVESSITIYHETNLSQLDKSFEEARDEAQSKAMQMVQNTIPETAQILSRNYELLKTPEQNLVRVKINVETIEDIGETINISQ
ncbi:hypothetical protein SCACP_20800 [Sporomusa carbonis]|uniref:sporulation protein YqfD n=1 Tax=Sporomusa carbonis TaxID=3076075 RepID=UPI003A620526